MTATFESLIKTNSTIYRAVLEYANIVALANGRQLPRQL